MKMRTPLICAATVTAMMASGCASSSAWKTSRAVASDAASITPADLQCYRDARKAGNRPSGQPWGFDGPITVSLGEVATARYGVSDEYDAQNKNAIVQWYQQNGSRYGIADGNTLLQVEFPPYSAASFDQACPDSDNGSVNLVDIQGRRYYLKEDAAGLSEAFDPSTFKSITPGLEGESFDSCIRKETNAENIQYYGWSDGIKKLQQTADNPPALIAVTVEGKRSVLTFKPLAPELQADFVSQLNSGINEVVGAAFTSYQLKVRAQKDKMRPLLGPPTFASDTVAPDASADLQTIATVASCQTSPLFKPLLDAATKRINDCHDGYASLHQDCSQ